VNFHKCKNFKSQGSIVAPIVFHGTSEHSEVVTNKPAELHICASAGFIIYKPKIN